MTVETRMDVKYPGLLKEKLPSGQYRYRVRVEGNPRKRIRLHVAPGHKDFSEHYHAARAGVEIEPGAAPADNTIQGSIAWLTHKHLEDLEQRVAANVQETTIAVF